MTEWDYFLILILRRDRSDQSDQKERVEEWRSDWIDRRDRREKREERKRIFLIRIFLLLLLILWNDQTKGREKEKGCGIGCLDQSKRRLYPYFLNYYLYYIYNRWGSDSSFRYRMNNRLLLLINNYCVIQVMHIIWWSFSHKGKRYLIAFSHRWRAVLFARLPHWNFA